MSNISKFSDSDTANTDQICAIQRATYLKALGVAKVLELCVGPSLSVLESAYKNNSIQCWGNDIDPRWREYYSRGKWLIGDAFDVFERNCQLFDAVVFAPPLSRGCSGKREDSLSIDDVYPKYSTFIEIMKKVRYSGYAILVLPGRSLSTKADRSQFYKLQKYTSSMYADFRHVELVNGCRKYTDFYINGRSEI